MKALILIFVLSLSARASTLNFFRPWPGISDPLIMGPSFERKLFALPMKGIFADKKKMWSGDYWPSNKGSINYRWNAPVPNGFHLRSPHWPEVQRLKLEELAALSPSEKFDLLNGNYHYPLKNQVKGLASRWAKEWEGICHGWAPAAMNHNEPTPKVLMNPDGIKVPFGSSDIKAIISYFYAKVYRTNTHQMGARCNRKRWRKSGCKDDMNAGAFHIVLANKVGIEGKSIIADMAHGKEVWNHPLYRYVSTITADNLPPYPSSAIGTKKMVRVKTELTYLLESDKNSWSPVIGTNLQLFETVPLEYMLDIDETGTILGGEWISKERPDFLWTMATPGEFTGHFKRLSQLLND